MSLIRSPGKLNMTLMCQLMNLRWLTHRSCNLHLRRLLANTLIGHVEVQHVNAQDMFKVYQAKECLLLLV